jgi:glutathione S-transferase
MKLYYSPGACSVAIHILLEEIGKPFELQRVDFTKSEQYGPEYVAINPKSKVPALQRDDGSLLTELPAIAWYLARINPDAKLLPSGAEGEARTLEIIDYLVATVHMRGFTRLFRPSVFAPSPADSDAVKETGAQIITQGFRTLEPVLGDKDYLLGDFSIADCALFFIELWASKRANHPMPPAFTAHLNRMLVRPAVQRALATEGLA